mmetsp:Transcript_74763/g.178422  ORF Transcript_74763/g.178422 Transcript_74763/m.178422 type:complete len:255 (+) Transcript_74763:853-1617(+)
MLQHANGLDDIFGSLCIQEPGATACFEAAHKAKQKENVEAKGVFSLPLNLLLKLSNIGWYILSLQHLSKVEGFVDLQCGSCQAQALLTQLLHRRHHVVAVIQQIEHGTFWAPVVVGHLANHELGFAQRADGQKNQDSLNLLNARPHPVDDRLQLLPLLPSQANGGILWPGEYIVAVRNQCQDADARGLGTITLLRLLKDDVRAGLRMQLCHGTAQLVRQRSFLQIFQPSFFQKPANTTALRLRLARRVARNREF